MSLSQMQKMGKDIRMKSSDIIVLGIDAAFILLGGDTITVFAMSTMTGVKLIIQDELSGRSMTIVGLAVAMGIGITTVPQSLELFPFWVIMVFGRSAVVISTLIAFGLNLILPQQTLADEQEKRRKMEQEG